MLVFGNFLELSPLLFSNLSINLELHLLDVFDENLKYVKYMPYVYNATIAGDIYHRVNSFCILSIFYMHIFYECRHSRN